MKDTWRARQALSISRRFVKKIHNLLKRRSIVLAELSLIRWIFIHFHQSQPERFKSNSFISVLLSLLQQFGPWQEADRRLSLFQWLLNFFRIDHELHGKGWLYPLFTVAIKEIVLKYVGFCIQMGWALEGNFAHFHLPFWCFWAKCTSA